MLPCIELQIWCSTLSHQWKRLPSWFRISNDTVKIEKEKSDAPSLCLTRILHRRVYFIAKACLFLPFTLLTCSISNRTDFGVWKRHRACRRIVDLCIQSVTKHVTWNTFGGYIPILGQLPTYRRFLCKYKPLVIRKISHIFLYQYIFLFLRFNVSESILQRLVYIYIYFFFFVFHSLFQSLFQILFKFHYLKYLYYFWYWVL